MNQELIEALKKNEKPLGFMLGELLRKFTQKEIYDSVKEIGRNFQFCCTRFKPARWPKELYLLDIDTADSDRIVRLRPDYQEQPAIIECEVKEYKGTLRWHHADGTPIACITYATEYPNFIGFKYKDQDCLIPNPLAYMDDDGVLHFLGDIKKINSVETRIIRPTHACFSK